MSRPHWRLESVRVRRQQQCPDKCIILSELSGVGFFNFHQYCACYSTFFLFVIVYTFMWKIHTIRIFCYQPIGDGFVDKHIVEWIFLMHCKFIDVEIEEPFGCRGQSCRKIINVRNWCYQLAATAQWLGFTVWQHLLLPLIVSTNVFELFFKVPCLALNCNHWLQLSWTVNS